MKNIISCCIIFLSIYLNQIGANDPEPDPEPKKATVSIIRAPVPSSTILPNLIRLDKSLQIQGAVQEIQPTQKEIYWIKRFITTLKNWLGIVTEITKLESYQNGYYEIIKKVYDQCLDFEGKTPVQVRYRKEEDNGAESAQNIYAYNFLPFWICSSGFGLGAVNIKSLDIHFVQSKKKNQTPDGQMLYRKDRVYDLEIEITTPWVILRVDHEIIQWGEEKDPNEEKISNGVMRVKLNDVKITMSIQLTEIDKRFVKVNTDGSPTYYFRLPKLNDFSLSVNNIQRYNNEIQKKKNSEGEYVGKGINTDRAEKIIVDLTDLFESEAGREEISRRVKPVIVNKCAEAMMAGSDILVSAINAVAIWEETEPKIPPIELTNDDIKFIHEDFYSGYNTTGLLAKALNFIITHFQNIRNNKVTNVDIHKDQKPSEYNVGEISVHDDGFDFSEKPAKKST